MPPRNLTLLPPPAPDQHVSVELLRQYAAGALVPAQQYHVEAHTSECTRCAEVLEGLSITDYATTERGLASARSRLHTRLAVDAARHSHRYAAWTGIAATLLLLVVAASVFWLNSRPFMVRHTLPANAPTGAAVLTPPSSDAKSVTPVPVVAVAPDFEATAVAPGARVAPATVAYPTTHPPQVAYHGPVARPQATVAATRIRSRSFAYRPIEEISADVSSINQPASATTSTSSTRLENTAANTTKPAAEAYSEALAAMEPRVSRALLATTLPAPRVEAVTLSRDFLTSSTAQLKAGATTDMNADKINKLPAAATAPGTEGRTAMRMPPSPDLASVPSGGHAAFRRYLKKELKFPEADRAKGVEGVVKLRFMVAADGSLQDIKVVSPVSEECDAEAIRLLKEGPAWYPAIVRGKRVPTVMRVSVTFNPLN